MSDKKSFDVLGIKPVADAIKIVTQGTVDGASAFLSRICLPASEEIGLLLKDKVHAFRADNLVAVAKLAEKCLGDLEVHAEPRMVAKILDESSWVDDVYLQDMWGGLLASSCTERGDDDSNVIFLNLLSQMTKAQARLLNYICDKSDIFVAENGLPWAKRLKLTKDELARITEIDDLYRLDRELDHLRSLELVDGGFGLEEQNATFRLTAIGLGLYVRCQGSRLSPKDFLKLQLKSPDFLEFEDTTTTS